MVDVVVRLPISRSCGSPSAKNQQRIHPRTHVQPTGQPPPPRSSDPVEAATPSRRNATENMYLANPRPWGNNSRGGERSFTRRCERQVRRGAPFIGGGGAPKGLAAGHGGYPLPSFIHVGGHSTHKMPFKIPPLKSPLKFPLNFHQI